MSEALEVLVGAEPKGLSASTVARLKRQWAEEYQSWRNQSLYSHPLNSHPLNRHQWVYQWADGIHSGVRAVDAGLCAFAVIGVDEKGHKQLLAIEDGTRESTQGWREVLLKLRQRGMNTPKLGIGDGALGYCRRR